MKRLGQIREDYDLVTEKVEAESNRLAMLVRAGLFDSKKLPMLKRALSKDVKDMTPAERKILIELLDSLMSEVLQSPQVYNKVKQNVMVKEVEESLYEATGKSFDGYLSKADPRFSKMPTEREIPTVIILKRKAIRIYPDNQKVALYYSQALDKYVTIPFGAMEGGSVNESVDDLKTKSDNLTKELPTNTNTPPAEGKPKVKPRVKPKVAPKRKPQQNLYNKKLNTALDVGRARDLVQKDDSMDTATKMGVSAGLKLRQQALSIGAKSNKPKPARSKAPPVAESNISENKGAIAKSKFYEKRNQQIDEAFPLLAVGAGMAARAIASRVAASGASAAGKVAAGASRAAAGAGRAAAGAGRATGRGLKRIARGAAGAAGAVAGSLVGSDDAQERTFSQPKEFSLKASTNQAKNQQIRTAVKPKENKPKNSSNVMESLYSMGSNEEKRLVIADESILINTITAKKIIGVYESLNRNNQEKVNSLLNESIGSFKKFANFAAKQ
jgi:hypothetical protein